ncbi:MAG: serine dehydratase subunit alpha family protein [Clostridia bacterium]|nr:serine dehydratase subunit alpha family protein [Clostridia bacterium]
MLDDQIRNAFLAILREELIPAMGCTEPIALAYAAARAREFLPGEPVRMKTACSGNMIKNVRSVQIPHSGGMHGIEAAVILGEVGGDAGLGMEVLSPVTQDAIEKTRRMREAHACTVEYLDSEIPLHFTVEVSDGENTVFTEVKYEHLNIVKIVRNGDVLKDSDQAGEEETTADRSLLSMERIKAFADEVDLGLVRDLIERQIRYNMDIAYEGISGNYGLGIGRVLRSSYPDSDVTRMKAYAAAASEARMDGCDMPVIINSGSGNQGIASSVPVIIYAREHDMPQEKLYRALLFSALLTIYQKEFIGKLSAFCGAVSASCASGAAVTYLCGGTLDQIKATVGNTLANIPGIICDGAKVSCAAKIASSLDAAMMAHYLSMNGQEYQAYTGILKEEIGETISCVGQIAKDGMKQTDQEIVKLMLEK